MLIDGANIQRVERLGRKFNAGFHRGLTDWFYSLLHSTTYLRRSHPHIEAGYQAATMPLIEELANSTSIRAPGYTLVPDHGQGTVQAAAQPTAGRNKRSARFAGPAGTDTTVAQQNATAKHLADLDKDSQRDVQIAVPAKQRESTAGKG